MRTLGSLVLSFFFFGSFIPFKAAQASDVRKEKPIQKFLLAQYQGMQNYDPQAIMNKWQGKVLNQSEQTQMRPSSDQQRMYGNGTGMYPESSYMYPSQPAQAPAPTASAANPQMYGQSYMMPLAPQAPMYAPTYPSMNPRYQYPAPASTPYSAPAYPSSPGYSQSGYPPAMYPQGCFCT